MHELSIARHIIEAVDAQARKEGLEQVTAISLEIGELTGVISDSLMFSFEFASKGTLSEGAILDITTRPTRAFCSACESDFAVTDRDFQCPVCSGRRISITGGREMLITGFEGGRPTNGRTSEGGDR